MSVESQSIGFLQLAVQRLILFLGLAMVWIGCQMSKNIFACLVELFERTKNKVSTSILHLHFTFYIYYSIFVGKMYFFVVNFF